MQPIRLFVGYDRDEALAHSVFVHSVHRHASVPVAVQALMLSQLTGCFNRPRDPLQSTEFAFTRFLVPYLSGFEGWAIFADGDMLCQADIAELWALRDDRRAVMVVMREDQPVTGATKFLGRPQTAYPRKNWSSVMMFNNALCRRLTPEYIERAPGLELHQLKWLRDDADLGGLPSAWNHLVGVDAPNPGAKIVHFTLGMPFFMGLRECEYATEWRGERDLMMRHA